jgi:hypothetical protein
MVGISGHVTFIDDGKRGRVRPQGLAVIYNVQYNTIIFI